MTTAAATGAAEILERLRRLPPDNAEAAWAAFPRDEWPALFRLVAVAADLPRLAGNATLETLPADLWPELSHVTDDLVRLQTLVDRPCVPPEAVPAPVFGPAEVEEARAELERGRCVTVEGLLDADGRRALDSAVAALAAARAGTWGQLERGEAPALDGLMDAAVSSELFGALTGYDPARDEHTLTLSLQDLDRAGIGWHRDLYWPREWVGEDVFAVLYSLGDDAPEKGGAFLHYAAAANDVHALYRRRHQATVVWNARRSDERPLHAVSAYHGPDTARHLVILQCLRRQR